MGADISDAAGGTATLTGVAGELETVTLRGDAAGATGPPPPLGFGRGIAATGFGLGTAAGAGAGAGAGAAIPAASAAVAGDATVLGSGSFGGSALGGDDAVGGSTDQPVSAWSFETVGADIGEDGGAGLAPASGRLGSDKGGC